MCCQYERLRLFAASLARPVEKRWLDLEVADVSLLLAADRAGLAPADLVDVWRDLQGVLRRAAKR
jgi:hypothetical protein